MKRLPLKFYNQKTEKVARLLLGCYLVSKTKEGTTIGKIVETEAYLSNDPASHSFKGETKRNSPMFSHPGTIYIYFTYGMYHCFNIVTEKKGKGEAVLIRALEPIRGIELMKKRRKTDKIENLCNGPAKLVQALGISPKLNSKKLNACLYILPREAFGYTIPEEKIVQTERVGISKGKELKLRFYLKGNKFVSNLKFK